MQSVLVIVSCLLASANSMCWPPVVDGHKWRCGWHLDNSLINKPLDEMIVTRPLDDEVKSFDDVYFRKWRPWKYLDDVLYYEPYRYISSESGSWESSHEYTATRECFTSVLRATKSPKTWKIHYVYLVHEAMTYHDAREHCEEKQGNLVKIERNNDDIKIKRLIKGKCGREGDYWIGLNKLDEDGRGGKGYYWDLDHSFPEQTYWWRGANKKYHCAAMVQEGNYDWSDRYCDQKMYFICEYDHRL